MVCYCWVSSLEEPSLINTTSCVDMTIHMGMSLQRFEYLDLHSKFNNIQSLGYSNILASLIGVVVAWDAGQQMSSRLSVQLRNKKP